MRAAALDVEKDVHHSAKSSSKEGGMMASARVPISHRSVGDEPSRQAALRVRLAVLCAVVGIYLISRFAWAAPLREFFGVFGF